MSLCLCVMVFVDCLLLVYGTCFEICLCGMITLFADGLFAVFRCIVGCFGLFGCLFTWLFALLDLLHCICYLGFRLTFRLCLFGCFLNLLFCDYVGLCLWVTICFAALRL